MIGRSVGFLGMLSVVVSCLMVGPGILLGVAAASGDVAINEQRPSYDTQAGLCRLADSCSWAVWKAYLRGRDSILARQVSSEPRAQLGPVIELSDPPGVVDSPTLAGCEGRLWAFWSAKQKERWRIIGRSMVKDRWGPQELLSDTKVDAICPDAIRLGNGRVVVAWSEFESSRSRIRIRWNGNGGWSRPIAVNDGKHSAYRPILVEHGNELWAVWDEYVGINYVVKGRQVLPQCGPIEQISPATASGQRCLTPVAVSSARLGLCVAWLKLTDIVGGEGVIDQLHTLQMAIRHKDGWHLVRDEAGKSDEAAYLVYGLLSDLGGPGYPSGYLGRRRHPLLVADEQGVWLMWEQKSDHKGTGLTTPGDLLGRHCTSGVWGPIRRLHHGLLDYRVARPATVADGKLIVVGSSLPINWTRTYYQVSIDPGAAQSFTPPRWDNQFRPVELPLDKESPRHTIVTDGRPYKLFWADMHCHGGFTCDAEGEPDELLHYGRDRARLDVMVLQDNDELYHCLLTESEYWLAALHSQQLLREGRFLSLPGFEWTQRVPRPGVPFNPLIPVYEQKGTFPNHRTVIYPPAGGPILRYPEVAGSFDRLCETVAAAGGIMHTQHHVFVPTDHECETNMEVATGWGIYIHRATEHFHRVLSDGYRFGFLGCSDSHRRNPGLCGGLTGIYAEALTPPAIFEALRAHRCFATNGSKIILDARANGRLLGEEVTASEGAVSFDLCAFGTRPIVSASLISGGKEIAKFAGTGEKELRVRHQVQGVPKGQHWFYWEVAQEGTLKQYRGNTCVARGNLAWSSPHWVRVP